MEDDLETIVALIPKSAEVGEFRRLTKRNVVQLGCSFCALFIAFNTMQSFESKLNKDLGLVALSSLYAAFSVCNLFAGAIVEFLGERKALFVGGLTYVAYLGANLYAQYYTLVPAAIVLGWGASVLWAAQGSFLSKNCDDETRGKHSGIFWALFQFNGVIGNLVAATFLHFEDDNVTFLIVILFVVGCFATFSFLFLRPIPASPQTVHEAEMVKKVDLIQCLRQFGDKRMVMLIPVFIYSGLSQSFFFSKFPQFISLKMLGFVMASFGASNTLSSMTMGRVSDVVGRKPVLLLASILALIGYGISYEYDRFDPYSYFVALVILGASDAGYNTQMYAVVSTFKKDEAEAAFAFLKLFQASSTGIAFFYSLYLGFDYIVYIVSGACVLAIISFFMLDLFVEKVDNKTQTIN